MFFGFSRTAKLATTAAFVLTAGCATKPPPLKHARVHVRTHKSRQASEQLQDLKERNLVLEQRAVMRMSKNVDDASADVEETSTQVRPALPKSFDTSAPKHQITKQAKAMNAEPPQAPTAAAGEKMGDHYLYSKILETYRARKSAELERTVELLLKSYPDSIFADNAIYLSGLLAFESDDFKTAVRLFDKLIRDYPRSNKVVSALFAKAAIEKKSGRSAQAKRGFLLLKDLYPGSPEAARVSVELKLLDLASTKHRES